MTDPITQPQEHIAFQDEEISRLSDELYAQQREIARLRMQLERLEARIKTLANPDSGIRNPEEETPPPHY